MNHVLPAWDIAAGLYLSTALLAAERARRRAGHGQEVTLSLADVMLATVANLGYVADVQVNGAVRPPMGNDLYGAFGRDFRTVDGRHVMLAAISNRQWRAIGKATGLADRLAMIGPVMDVDMATEGGRFAARAAIAAVLEPWFAGRSLDEVRAALDGSGVLWGPYQDFGQLVREDWRCSPANPMFADIEQAGVGRVLANGTPLGFSGAGAFAASSRRRCWVRIRRRCCAGCWGFPRSATPGCTIRGLSPSLRPHMKRRVRSALASHPPRAPFGGGGGRPRHLQPYERSA